MTIGLADQTDLALGAATLRPSSCEIETGGDTVSLEPQVMRALMVLARSPGRVVSKDALIAQAWDGRSVSEDAVNRVISRLRRLAETSGVFQLTTLRKVGYRLDISSSVSPALPDEAEAGPTPPQGRRDWRGPAAVSLVLLLTFAALVIWPGLVRRHAADAPTPHTIAVTALSASGDQAAVADRLTAQLRTTLSHMQGLRLVDAPAGATPSADLRLAGAVSGSAAQPVIDLTLNAQPSGARIWGATFDGRGIVDPTPEERAVSAAARYLAIWLGDRMAGEPAAREPANPEVARIVAGAHRSLAVAHEARHNRDWKRFAELVAETRAAQDRALAIDPRAAEALMLGYEIDAVPEYPRPDETPATYAARQRRAAQLLARALAADPDDPEALAAAGHDAFRNMRWAEAGKLLERAVAIDPNSLDANSWSAYHLGLVGQCQAGLERARVAAGLAPNDTWRQMGAPRLLHCAGRRAEAERAYRDLLARDPGNVFVLHELYLMLLGERAPDRLRRAADEVRRDLWKAAPPAPVAEQATRMDLAADALEGRPQAFLTILDGEARDLSAAKAPRPGFGSTKGDQMFTLALEFSEAGQTARAMDLLRGAVEAGSLYLPWALPYGPTEFPPSMRADPAYAALWKSSPGLADLMRRRAAARR